jgi:uncharacterized protein YecA (UPF0149 family)
MGVEEVTGITDRLKGKIEAYRQKFDAWAATQNGQLQKVKQQQDIAISTGESQITDLMAQSQALEVEVARAHQDHAVAKHEVDSMRGELGPLKARAAVYPEKMRLAQQTLDEERSLLANSRASECDSCPCKPVHVLLARPKCDTVCSVPRHRCESVCYAPAQNQ